MIYLSFKILKSPYRSYGELYVWTPRLPEVVTVKRPLQFTPTHISLSFNGFMQDIHIHTSDVGSHDHLHFQCHEGCKKCTGRNNGECLECEFGYYGIETSNGLVCLAKSYTLWTVVILGVTLLYLLLRGYLNTKVLTYRCRKHKEFITFVAIGCGHMLCDACTDNLAGADGLNYCPSCNAQIGDPLPANFEAN